MVRAKSDPDSAQKEAPRLWAGALGDVPLHATVGEPRHAFARLEESRLNMVAVELPRGPIMERPNCLPRRSITIRSQQAGFLSGPFPIHADVPVRRMRAYATNPVRAAASKNRAEVSGTGAIAFTCVL